jgi:hypothetical protein
MRRFHRGYPWEDLIAAAGLGFSILVGYLFAGGLTYTIPKYQYPAIPLFALVIGVAIGTDVRISPGMLRRCGLLLGVWIVYYAMIGDPLLRLLYGSREFIWRTNLSPQISTEYLPVLLTDFFLVLLPVLIAGVVAAISPRGTRLARLLVSLMLVMFGYNIGLGSTQARAGYATTYSYGMRGVEGVLDAIRSNSTVLVYEGTILGPWNTKRIHFVEMDFRNGEHPLVALERTDADYFLVGLPINRIAQLQSLQSDRKLEETLRSRFVEHRLGDFLLYERRRSSSGGIVSHNSRMVL